MHRLSGIRCRMCDASGLFYWSSVNIYILMSFYTGRLAVVDIAEVNPCLGNAKDVKTTVETTISVIERFCGNRRQGVYPSGYDIPHALSSKVESR